MFIATSKGRIRCLQLTVNFQKNITYELHTPFAKAIGVLSLGLAGIS